MGSNPTPSVSGLKTGIPEGSRDVPLIPETHCKCVRLHEQQPARPVYLASHLETVTPIEVTRHGRRLLEAGRQRGEEVACLLIEKPAASATGAATAHRSTARSKSGFTDAPGTTAVPTT
ncbi:MAG: hypothetical protein ACKO28_07080 [Cyanobium sp.]